MHFSSRACREPLVCMMKKVLFYSFTIVLIVIWSKYTICAQDCFPKFVGNVCFLDSNSRNLTQKRKKRFSIYLFVRFLFIRSSGFGQMNQSPNYLATRKKVAKNTLKIDKMETPNLVTLAWGKVAWERLRDATAP